MLPDEVGLPPFEVGPLPTSADSLESDMAIVTVTPDAFLHVDGSMVAIPDTKVTAAH